jgi:hypothetical protein
MWSPHLLDRQLWYMDSHLLHSDKELELGTEARDLYRQKFFDF